MIHDLRINGTGRSVNLAGAALAASAVLLRLGGPDLIEAVFLEEETSPNLANLTFRNVLVGIAGHDLMQLEEALPMTAQLGHDSPFGR